MSSQVLTIEDVLSDNISEFDDIFDDNNDDYDQYSEADFQKAWLAVNVLRECDIREMLAQNFTLENIVKVDRDQQCELEKIERETNREFREIWESKTDAYDLVDIAHSENVELSQYDTIARRLGYGWNWSEGAERRRAYKEKKSQRKNTFIVSSDVKEIIEPAPVKVLLPRKILFKKAVTIENLSSVQDQISRIPASRKRPGRARIWQPNRPAARLAARG